MNNATNAILQGNTAVRNNKKTTKYVEQPKEFEAS